MFIEKENGEKNYTESYTCLQQETTMGIHPVAKFFLHFPDNGRFIWIASYENEG